MAQIAYAGNLASQDFPFLAAWKSQSVILGQKDQNYDLQNNPNRQQSIQKEKEIPEIFYCENVMPTAQGYQSVGFTKRCNPIGGGHVNYNICNLLSIDTTEERNFYSEGGARGGVGDNTSNYTFNAALNAWTSHVPAIAQRENTRITFPLINGRCYVFQENVGLFQYNPGADTFTVVVLTGIVAANILGMCASNGFLIAWDASNTVFRSQAASPFDFTPDPNLGSGSGIPEYLKGRIVGVLPIANGYMVYTTENIVAALFQNNIRYPFIYREVQGGEGIISMEHVGLARGDSEDHYVWTRAGFQRVNKQTATPVFADVTDFLVAKQIEDFNPTTHLITLTNCANQLHVGVKFISGRFVVISYGVNNGEVDYANLDINVIPGPFSYAIIYDVLMKRFGKVKIVHTTSFEYTQPSLAGTLNTENFKEKIGFLQADGTVYTLDFSQTPTNNAGVIILGKYQYIRERLIELQEVEVQNVAQGATFSMTVRMSIDGVNISIIDAAPTLALNAGLLRRYNMRDVGKNLDLVFAGSFHLTSLGMKFQVDGRR